MICRITIILLLFSNLSFAQSYDLYVSDAGNFDKPPWQIIKYDDKGENPEVFIDSNLNWPQDILFLEEPGEVLISNLGSGRITKHDASTGALIDDFANGIGGPTRMKIGADNLLYILQWNGNGKVLRYDLGGNFVDEFTSVGVPQSIGMDWDQEGRLYVSSYTGKMVRQFDKEGKDLGVFISTDLDGPTNIWFDSSGDLLVSDYSGTSVKRFDSEGKYQSEFMMGLKNSEGVDFFPNGDILIGNGNTKSVKLYNADGVFIKDYIASGLGGLKTPNAVVLRENKTNQFEVVEKEVRDAIYPTVGRIFYVDSQYVKSVERMEVYSPSGQKLAKTDDNFWNSGQAIAGVYRIRLIMDDHRVLTQTVVVVE